MSIGFGEKGEYKIRPYGKLKNVWYHFGAAAGASAVNASAVTIASGCS